MNPLSDQGINLEAGKPLRIASYGNSPVAGVEAILARCINACTPHACRCLWGHSGYNNGTDFEGGINWNESPAEAEAVIREADLVIAHNGEIEQRHIALLTGKAIITMVHNFTNPIELDFVKQGLPGVVVGQSLSTLPEFQGWSSVPHPIPLWEEAFQPGEKGEYVTICYTPDFEYRSYSPDHPDYLYPNGYDSTMRILDKLAAQFPICLEVIRDRDLSHAQVLEMKRRAHIVIDECVTGSYHRNSLEGLATGCVVVNGVGLLPGEVEALRNCAGGETSNPFVFASLEVLEGVLTSLIQHGPISLAEEGKQNHLWMEKHWDFTSQWQRFWLPVVNKAMNLPAPQREEQHSEQVMLVSHTQPNVGISIVIASHNEGKNLRRTVDSLLAHLPTDGEVIVVDDASTDDSTSGLIHTNGRVTLLRPTERLGAPQSRNYGAGYARGHIIVFSDAHIEVPPGWVTPFMNVLARPEVGAVGPVISDMHHPESKGYGLTWYRGAPLEWKWLEQQGTQPYAVPLLGAGFLAMRREVFTAIGGFDSGLIMYGMEDAELSIRLWTLGFECIVVPSVDVAHLYHDPASYPSYQLNWETGLHNMLRLAVVHLGPERIRRLIEYRSRDDVFPAAFARLATGDAWARRSEIHRVRRYDDDWFFSKFNMD